MGDRTHCILTILGQLPLDLGVALRNSMGKPSLVSERQREYEEVNYGEFPSDLRQRFAEEKISYTWRWGSGGGYTSGILVGHEGCETEWTTSNGEIVLTLAEIDNGVTVATAKEWEATIQSIEHPPRFSHAYDFAFSLFSHKESGADVTPSMLREALTKRLDSLTDAELMEACGQFDTHPVGEAA